MSDYLTKPITLQALKAGLSARRGRRVASHLNNS